MVKSPETPRNWATEVARLEQQVLALTARVEWYEAHFRLQAHRQFGVAHEGSDALQLQLFNEAEATAPSPLAPATETIVYERRKKTKGQREADLAHLPVERLEYTLPADEQVCGVCHGPLHTMSTEIRR